MDAMNLRLIFVLTDLIAPLAVGYYLHQRHLVSDESINKLIRFNVVCIYTILALLSFWVLPISWNLLIVPLFGFLLILVPGAIGSLLFARHYASWLDRGAYVASAMLSNIGTLGGVCAFILYAEQGSCMSGTDFAADYHFLYPLVKLQQSHRVCHGRPAFPDTSGDIFLTQGEFFHQPLIRLRFLDRVQVLSLDILNQRDFHGFLIREFPYDHRNFFQSGCFGGSPPSFTGNNLVTVILFLNDERLNNPVFFY